MTKIRLTLTVTDDGLWGFDDVLRLHDKEDVPSVIQELIEEDIFSFYVEAEKKIEVIEE